MLLVHEWTLRLARLPKLPIQEIRKELWIIICGVIGRHRLYSWFTSLILDWYGITLLIGIGKVRLLINSGVNKNQSGRTY